MNLKLNGSNRKHEAQALVNELNELYPALKEHTNVPAYSYALEDRLVPFLSYIAGLAVLIAICAFFFIVNLPVARYEFGKPMNLMMWKFELGFIVLLVLMLAIVYWCFKKHHAYYQADVERVKWNKAGIKELKQILTDAKKALAEHEAAVEAATPMLRKYQELIELGVAKEVVDEFKLNYQREPFYACVSIHDCECDYELTSESDYELLLEKIACYYYGRQYIPEFKKLLQP